MKTANTGGFLKSLLQYVWGPLHGQPQTSDGTEKRSGATQVVSRRKNSSSVGRLRFVCTESECWERGPPRASVDIACFFLVTTAQQLQWEEAAQCVTAEVQLHHYSTFNTAGKGSWNDAALWTISHNGIYNRNLHQAQLCTFLLMKTSWQSSEKLICMEDTWYTWSQG